MNDTSTGEEKLQKLERRDTVFKGFALLVLALAVAFNMFSAFHLLGEVDRFRQETLIAREANIERQEKIQDYIKCVVLLRFYEPPITEDSIEQEVRDALDSCADK